VIDRHLERCFRGKRVLDRFPQFGKGPLEVLEFGTKFQEQTDKEQCGIVIALVGRERRWWCCGDVPTIAPRLPARNPPCVGEATRQPCPGRAMRLSLDRLRPSCWRVSMREESEPSSVASALPRPPRGRGGRSRTGAEPARRLVR
jgi:hypothetical protein